MYRIDGMRQNKKKALSGFNVLSFYFLCFQVLDKTLRPFLVEKFPTCELEAIFGAEALP